MTLTLSVTNAKSRTRAEEVHAVLTELSAIRADMVAAPDLSQPRLDEIHPNYRKSAKNLFHYLALRRHDLRPLQVRLAALGLSSLGRAESHALASVDAVLDILHTLSLSPAPNQETSESLVDFETGERLLIEHTEALLGPAPSGRAARIMVTMPSEAASDPVFVRHLLQQGMDCMRINCAHDGPLTWLQMIQHLRNAEELLGKSCRIIMDLSGPKLRTGPLEPGPAVIRIRPRKDEFGRVADPARVWLTSQDSPQPPPAVADACFCVPEIWLARLRKGEDVKFTDARQANRTFKIGDVTTSGCWADIGQTAYLVPDTLLHHTHKRGRKIDSVVPVGAIQQRENAILLHPGDTLVLKSDLTPGKLANRDSAGKVISPASIGCTIPEVLACIKPGESIWFDDGKIGGIIEKVQVGQATVRITHTSPVGGKLRADKGINLPESDLHIDALTAKDLTDLHFVAKNADVVELSFANTARDVEMLQQHLHLAGSRQPDVVLKIETRRGFEHLPDMLLVAMRAPRCGVMIARGDLAVECGFERLAEVQEEILWICEAAHVPVIWATQVLETLAKVGMPSRAEITDAAMAHRAECVMLNKGPHVLSAVRVLDDILRRMQAHQAKKRAMLRELQLAHTIGNSRATD
jgi:pyruvate kinase